LVKNPAWLFRSYFKLAIMNTTESLLMEMPFSATETEKILVNDRAGKNITQKNERIHSINNYLKTPEEIDTELRREMNNRRGMMSEHKFLIDTYERVFKNRSDNAYSPDSNPSGFMEENY